MHIPTIGTASDVAGTLSATINWKTLSDNRIVIPTRNHTHWLTDRQTDGRTDGQIDKSDR